MKITPADSWFSKCVRIRADYTCEKCGTRYPSNSQALHCAHYETRDHWGIRFEPLNAFALCMGCHRYFDRGRRFEFEEFYKKKLGALNLDVLKEKSNDIMEGKRIKQTRGKGEISKHYKTEYERILKLRAKGKTGRIEFTGY